MIRRATEADLQALLDLGPIMEGQVLVPISTEKCIAECRQTLRDGQAFVALKDGQIIGSVAYYIATPWYTAQKMMFDKWMGVRADKRRSFLAGKLLNALVCEAKTLCLPLIFGVAGDLSNNAAFEKRYQRVAILYQENSDELSSIRSRCVI